MKVVCSFCNAEISPGNAEDGVSHGVCKSCYEKILTSHGLNIRRFLNLLDAPVFLVDNDVNIVAANSLALAIAGKPIEQARGNLCGKVLECVNSFIPYGCGKTNFCPACVLRSSVNETYKTGHRIDRRPAILHRSHSGSIENIRLLVTTEKDGDVVLLRLEPAAA